RNTGRSIDQFAKEAREIARQLPEDASALEVAPGPGFLAIELAKLGNRRITGLDISHSFVEIANENARRAGIDVSFQQGSASAMPFEADSYDYIHCRAAFKNFSEPIKALSEIRRVLKPGGRAVIHDLRRDTTPEEIKTAVNDMHLGLFNRVLTVWILS